MSKSSYALMAWKLKGGNEVLASIKEATGNLSLRSKKYKGLQVELNRNETSTSERKLGVRLSMDGNDDAEVAYQLDQSRTPSGKIMPPPLSTYRCRSDISREVGFINWLLLAYHPVH